MPDEIFYTKAELTEKKFSIGFAVSSALMIVKRRSRGQLGRVCADSIIGRPNEELLTIKELNDVVEKLVADTLYYG